MKFFSIALLIVTAVLTGCTTAPYRPREHPIRKGLVPEFPVAGKVTVKNAQSSRKEAIVCSYMGAQTAGNYREITGVMVNQVIKELRRSGITQPSSAEKSILIRVDYLRSRYRIMHWKSELKYTIKLGNDQTFQKSVRHAGINTLIDLNGCIAEAVLHFFRDQRVVEYLAQ